MGENPTGDRIYFKTPSKEDVTSYIRHLWSDEDSMRDVGGIHVLDDERAERWFFRWIEPGSDDRRYFLVIRKDDHVPIGEVCFHSYNPDTKTANYSMNIEAKYRRNGYGREALEMMLRFYFFDFGGETILDDIALENKRAQEMFLKFGFEHDPTRKDAFLVRMTKSRFEELYG
ncbi:MAG: GNAT family N-acetyltransferase [Alicyclobacillus sp.]|nr:GNAT family N-acetyltransferase [Alicyclobacillus sp.]